MKIIFYLNIRQNENKEVKANYIQSKRAINFILTFIWILQGYN
jgi:hypothetical protein